MPYDGFWRVSLREYNLIASAAIRRRRSELDARRALNQELAHLVAYAYHDPAKMPDLTQQRDRERSDMSEEEALERLRAHLIGLHARSSAEAG